LVPVPANAAVVILPSTVFASFLVTSPVIVAVLQPISEVPSVLFRSVSPMFVNLIRLPLATQGSVLCQLRFVGGRGARRQGNRQKRKQGDAGHKVLLVHEDLPFLDVWVLIDSLRGAAVDARSPEQKKGRPLAALLFDVSPKSYSAAVTAQLP
jgi:hypothetical protein